MCDGSVACITSVIISLVTAKNKYEVNALMKNTSSDNIWTEDKNINNKTQFTHALLLPLSTYIQWHAMNGVWKYVASPHF